MKKINLDELQRRPVRESDGDFLFRVFASAKEVERQLAPQCPDDMWDAFLRQQFALQSAHYDEHWRDNGNFDVIEHKGQPVGRIYEWRGEEDGLEHIQIVEFTVLTEFRNHGIGGRIMSEVIASADQAGLPIRTRIMPIELSRPFLERHGFSLLKDEQMTLLFERSPQSA
ncbi:MAG: GNAT family N-acetyltransferase [Planctomycetota bacterium]